MGLGVHYFQTHPYGWRRVGKILELFMDVQPLRLTEGNFISFHDKNGKALPGLHVPKKGKAQKVHVGWAWPQRVDTLQILAAAEEKVLLCIKGGFWKWETPKIMV